MSIISSLLVAPITSILWFGVNPSNSIKNLFNVLSFSWCDLLSLFLHRASISSINIIHFSNFLALLNNFRILAAPTPTYNSLKSGPELAINGILHSPAIAFANNVLPLPGGPWNNNPRGIFAPIFLYFSSLFRKCTNSNASVLISSKPATSFNRIVDFSVLEMKLVRVDRPFAYWKPVTMISKYNIPIKFWLVYL